MIHNIRPLLAAAFLGAVLLVPASVVAADEIPRAPSTPNTPKNWVGPKGKIHAQVLVDELMAGHPEIMSITIHAVPPGNAPDAYSMIAGSFPDRIGNMSSPGDITSAKKGVSQIEPKWGTPDYQKKVSVVLPLKDNKGNYLPAAMVIAFHTKAGSLMRDTDFLAPGIVIRDALVDRTPNIEALFAAAR